MSLLVPDTGLLFWMLISFGIVLAVLVRYAFPVIVGAMERRREHIVESLETARQAQERLASLEDRGREIIEKAGKDGQKLLTDARAQAAAIVEQAGKEAEKQSRSRLERAEAEAAELKRRATQQAVGEIAALAVGIAGKVVGEELKGDDSQKKLIMRLLNEENVKN